MGAYESVKEELSESGEKIGIEADEDESVIEPFDPDEISIQQRVVPMDVIIRRLKQGSIQLSPSFQRKEVWDPTRRSRLIESVMLNIPLPMFYVSADEEGTWEVVDGLQRLSTIRDFIIGDRDGVMLKLKNLEFLGEKYEGKTFRAIERDQGEQKVVNGIYETEMRFTVINPGTPEAVKRNIFKRLNTGGMPLTAQEIRHALYEGQSSELLQRLVNSESFKQAVGKKIDDSRMGASELILRLISFMVLDRSAYKQGMDTWLSNAMRVVNHFPDASDEQLKKIFSKGDVPSLRLRSIDEIGKQFELAMSRGKGLFHGHAFRKSLLSPTKALHAEIRFGADHACAGYLMGRAWDLPMWMKAGILYHQNDRGTIELNLSKRVSDITAIYHVATFILNETTYGSYITQEYRKLFMSEVEFLGLDMSAVDSIRKTFLVDSAR